MKKLKLYGEKKGFLGIKRKGFVAEIFVKDRKVVVESKDRKLKRRLREEIDKMIKEDGITLGKSVWERLPEGGKVHYHIVETKHPKDPKFIFALAGELEKRKIGKYKFIFHKSKFVEE